MQTFTDFELLIFDDGSSDSTPAILKEYTKRDQRVRVLKSKKSGFANVLNQGLKEARGNMDCALGCRR